MATANQRRITVNSAMDAELKAEDDFIVVNIFGVDYNLKKKFKRLKFLRLLSSDPGSALALVFEPKSLDRLEEIDMSSEQLEEVFKVVSEALVGTKN